MSQSVLNSEVICDRQGNPLGAKAATLLKALDRLLTVGAYYSAEHSQYLQAAMKARDSIVGVIGSPRDHVAIEITAQGLLVGGQSLDPHHRNVRALHELLVPLNIARLEIEGTLTPEDLRQAVAALQHHRTLLGQTNSFQEVVIEDLPASVRAVSCSVLSRTEAEHAGGDDGNSGLSLDDILSEHDSVEPKADGQTLVKQFLELVSRILANLEEQAGEQGITLGEGPSQSYVTVADLVALRQTLEHLVSVDPDPAELAKLITQAQLALGLSRDPESVELVFQILKKDMKTRKSPAAGHVAGPRREKYQYDVKELFGRAADLGQLEVPVAEPWSSSEANKLGIALHLLRSDPPRSLRGTLLASLEQVVARREFPEQYLPLYVRAAGTVVQQDGSEDIDDLLVQLTGILRQKSPRHLALFWRGLIDLAGTDALPMIWPHLVNDILLGMTSAPREVVARLVVAAGRLSLAQASAQSPRLEKLPALQGQTAAKDLFLAPLSASYSVVVTLLATPLQSWLSAQLFQVLSRKPGSPLVEMVMAALAEHDPLQTDLYLELISHGQAAEPPASLRDPAAALLLGRLEVLLSDQRGADWVAPALRELARLAPELAQPLLRRVATEKKFFFFPAWPAAARTAAKAAAGATGHPAAHPAEQTTTREAD